jgi:predicted ArsR family transcriptional regulator
MGASLEKGADRLVTNERKMRTHRALATVTRVRILEVLRTSSQGLDARQVAEDVGLHQNTVRSHLALLLDAGLVTKSERKSSRPGRPRAVFEAAEDGHVPDQAGYQMLARILASYLAGSTSDPSAAAESLGRSWGRYLTERPAPFESVSRDAAMEHLVELFAEMGFEPEMVSQEAGDQMLLHRCPYRVVAEARPDVVCSVHLGLMRGALAELDAPIVATELLPFVGPSLCVARLDDGSPL